jgi:hypothetical protein
MLTSKSYWYLLVFIVGFLAVFTRHPAMITIALCSVAVVSFYLGHQDGLEELGYHETDFPPTETGS